MSVTQKEIVEALRTYNLQGRSALSDIIERDGIAPPDGYAIVPIQDPDAFRQWLCREFPEGCVMGDPNWWAKRILRRFIPQAAAKESL